MHLPYSAPQSHCTTIHIFQPPLFLFLACVGHDSDDVDVEANALGFAVLDMWIATSLVTLPARMQLDAPLHLRRIIRDRHDIMQVVVPTRLGLYKPCRELLDCGRFDSDCVWNSVIEYHLPKGVAVEEVVERPVVAQERAALVCFAVPCRQGGVGTI